jgi:hypothetical protein
MGQLVLKRALASRSSGEWSGDDYDVLADGAVVGSQTLTPPCFTLRAARLRRLFFLSSDFQAANYDANCDDDHNGCRRGVTFRFTMVEGSRGVLGFPMENAPSRRLTFRIRAFCGKTSTGLACAHPGDRIEGPPVGGLAVQTSGGPFVMQSDRKSRLIAICMLAGAVAMIGLALTGTLQMKVSHSPVVAVVAQ